MLQCYNSNADNRIDRGLLVASLWSSKAEEFMKLWSDENNKDNKE